MLAAIVFLAGMGAGALEIDENFTSATYSQTSQTLALHGEASAGAMLTGYFTAAPLDWRDLAVLGLRVAARGEAPPVAFSMELLGSADFSSIINTYEGSTAKTEADADVLWLELSQPGAGDLADVRGILFRWGGSGEAVDITFDAFVTSTPVHPVVVSKSYSDGGFTLTWSGTGTRPVLVQRRELLETGQWTTIAQGIVAGEYTDTDPPAGKDFYRVVVP
jgi:hypothetical protein